MRIPPFHWWRTVFWLIPAISVYTIVLGALSLASMLIDRRGHLAHGCARTWSRWILGTTGVRVEARGLDRFTRGRSYVFVSNHQSIYDIPVLFASIRRSSGSSRRRRSARSRCSAGTCAGPAICSSTESAPAPARSARWRG